MKSIVKAFRLTLVFCVFLSVAYILVLWLFARVAGSNSGNAEVAMLNGKVVGAANVGQQFTDNKYFWGRPSCAGSGYDAANSAGSNMGSTNPEYLAEVEARIDTFLAHHPYLERKDIPAEMVTASGSGLDPDITPQCARVQVRRVAEARGMSIGQVERIVESVTQKPLLGLFGTSKINVLKLNIALDGGGDRKDAHGKEGSRQVDIRPEERSGCHQCYAYPSPITGERHCARSTRSTRRTT